MIRRRVRVMAVSVLLAFLFSSPIAAHEGGESSGISCEPAEVTAGGTVVLAGQGLEPNSDREIDLVGPDVIVPFPNVTTDGEGMFSVTLTIPAHLPAGAYTFRAVGDEILTTPLAVTAAAGVGQASGAPDVTATVTPRNRSPFEVGLLAGLILVAIAAGSLLVTRAERFGSADDS